MSKGTDIDKLDKQILSILILRKYRFRSRNLMDQKFRDVGSVLRLSFFARKFRAKGTLNNERASGWKVEPKKAPR